MTAKKDLPWDAIDWSNTHIETIHGMYHVGVLIPDDGPPCVAIATATDDKIGRPAPQIILLTEDEIDVLFKTIRYAAKSL